jgi:hypothetical protein
MPGMVAVGDFLPVVNVAVPRLAPCVAIFGLKFASRLNSFWGRRGGALVICIGVLVMGIIEHLPRNEQSRPDEPSLWDDEHSDEVHSLLEENALLRRILVKMDLVLKKIIDR